VFRRSAPKLAVLPKEFKGPTSNEKGTVENETKGKGGEGTGWGRRIAP